MSGSGPTAAAQPRGAAARLVHALPHLAMLAAAVFLYWSAGRIDAYTGGGTRIGPDAWPKAIIVFMGLLCAYEAVRRLLGRESGAAGLEPAASVPVPGADATPSAESDRPGMLAGGIALIAGYAVLVPWCGFFVTTALFLALFPWVGGVRRWVLCATLGLLGSFALVVLFMRVAYISLPLGMGPFRELSLGLLRWIGVT